MHLLDFDPDGSLVRNAVLDGQSVGGGSVRLFGCAIAPLGDVDRDGSADIAVGGKKGCLSVWVLFLGPDGDVLRSVHHRSDTAVGHSRAWGEELLAGGDLDGNGFVEFLSGGANRTTNGERPGPEMILAELSPDGALLKHRFFAPPPHASPRTFANGLSRRRDGSMLVSSERFPLPPGADWKQGGSCVSGASIPGGLFLYEPTRGA